MAVIGAINVIFGAITDSFTKGTKDATKSLSEFDEKASKAAKKAEDLQKKLKAEKLEPYKNALDALKGEGGGKMNVIKDAAELFNKLGDAAAAADKKFIEGGGFSEVALEVAKGLPVIGEFTQGLEKIARVITGLDRDIAKMEFAAKWGEQVNAALVSIQKFGMDAQRELKKWKTDLAEQNWINSLVGDEQAAAQAKVKLNKQLRDVAESTRQQVEKLRADTKTKLEALNNEAKGKDNVADKVRLSADINKVGKTSEAEVAKLKLIEAQKSRLLEQAAAYEDHQKSLQKAKEAQEKIAEKAKEEAEERKKSAEDATKTYEAVLRSVQDFNKGDAQKRAEEFTRTPGLTGDQAARGFAAIFELDKLEKAKAKAEEFKNIIEGLNRDLAESKDPGKGGAAFDLAKMGLNSAQLDQVKALRQQLEAINALTEKRKEMEAAAKSIIESGSSPLEKAQAEMKKLNELLDAGLLTRKQFEKAKLGVEKGLGGGGTPVLPGLTERRFSFDMPETGKLADPALELKKIAEEELKVAKEAKLIEKQQLELMKKGGIALFDIDAVV